MSNQPPENPYGTPSSGDNPYGQNPNPSGGGDQPAYGQYGQGGQTPPNPYGAPSPYGAPASGGGEQGNDGLSIAAFVLSLTCCLSFVGVILGVIGLRRTGAGKKKGRWAAISAIVVGSILTLCAVGFGIFIAFIAQANISIDEAKVGQCLNVSESDDDSVLLLEKECGSSHDAQIVYVGTVKDIDDSGVAPSNPDEFTDSGASALICGTLMDAGLREAVVAEFGEDLEFGIASETGDMKASSERFICYVEGDEKISKKIS